MRWILVLTLFVGCKKDKDEGTDDSGAATDSGGGEGGEGGEGGDDTSAPTQEELFAQFINTTDVATGDQTCYTGDSFVNPEADASCVMDAIIGEGKVEDFAFEEPVAGVAVNFYGTDTVEGTPVLSTTSDGDGVFTGTLPTCTALVQQAGPITDLYVDTYQFHEMMDHAGTVNVGVTSVAEDTWITLPSIAGVILDDSLGVIAGGSYDCNGDPLIYSQVVLRDADGNIPETLRVAYVFGGLPSRTYTSTTEDGIWIAMNVPPGQYTIEQYIADGAGGWTLTGTSPVQTFSHSVSISSVYMNRSSGLWIPSSCREACAD